MKEIKSIQPSTFIMFFAGILVLVICVLFFSEPIAEFVRYIKNEHTHPAAIILAFLVLPVFFFPVSPLLMLIGLRFDALYGVLLMFLMIPFHLAISYLVTRKLLYRFVLSFLRRKTSRFIPVPQNRQWQFSWLFMAIPGLSYAAKNYLLPAPGVPFRIHLTAGWIAQGVMGIPFIVLGEAAAQWNATLLFAFILLFAIAFLIFRIIRKRLDRTV